MIDCDAPGCFKPATHALVDYYHVPIEDGDSRSTNGLYFCAAHAFDDDRECCHICENHGDQTTKIEEINTGIVFELKRTYPSSELDNEGMCSDHP
jgi:hypothetical protein